MRAAAQGTVGAEGKVKRLRKKLKKEMDMRQILEDQRPKGRLYNLRHNIGTNTGPDPTPAIEEEGAADEEGSLALSHTGSHGQEGSVGQLSRELSVQSFFAPTNKQVAANKSEESSLEGSLSKDVSLPRIGNIGGGEGGSLIGDSLVGGSLVGGSLQTSSLEASELSGVLVGRDDGKITSHKGGQKQELSFSFQEMQVRVMHVEGLRFRLGSCHGCDEVLTRFPSKPPLAAHSRRTRMPIRVSTRSLCSVLFATPPAPLPA